MLLSFKRLHRFGLCTLAGIAVTALGCGQPPGPVWPDGKSPRVLVSFAPLYCFAANVAGDDAAVLTLLKTTGPHEYQPTSQDTLKLRQADLFFINGLELDENFANKLKDNSGNAKLKLIELGERLKTKIPLSEEDKKQEAAGHEGHHHKHGEFDPHVWLGLPEAIAMVEIIRDELKEIDPAHAAGYDQRAGNYIEQLRKLHRDGKDALGRVKKEGRKLIAFHDSLRYFARAFDLDVIGVMEMRPGIAPDPSYFKKLVDLCKQHDIRVIAVEPQYPQEAAQRLLEGIGKRGVTHAKLVEIDPLETAAPEDFSAEHGSGRDFYVRKMKTNLDRLQEQLQ
jgi:ABC-type Zn uptake system ZnuABC Zn-binding protein ZnuA